MSKSPHARRLASPHARRLARQQPQFTSNNLLTKDNVEATESWTSPWWKRSAAADAPSPPPRRFLTTSPDGLRRTVVVAPAPAAEPPPKPAPPPAASSSTSSGNHKKEKGEKKSVREQIRSKAAERARKRKEKRDEELRQQQAADEEEALLQERINARQLHEDDLALRAVADAERFNTVFLQQCLAWNRKSKQPANEATNVSPEVSPLFRRHRPASSSTKPRQQQQQQPAPQRHQGMSVQDIVAGLKTPAPGRPGGPPHGAVFEKLEIRR